jgi:hypothetical protein
MAKVRWIAAVAAVMAGGLVALVAAPAGRATPRPAACLLICTTTTTTTSTSPTSTSTPAPVLASAGGVGVSALASTAATFAAGFDPGVEGATYQFQVLFGGQIVSRSPSVTVSPGDTATAITYTASGLTPNEPYQVQLSYYNDVTGNAQDPTNSAPTAFTTPLEPAAVPVLTAGARAITIGQRVSLTATANDNPLGSTFVLQDAVAPSERFGDFLSLTDGPAPVTGTITTAESDVFSEMPTANMRLRLLLPGTSTATHSVQLPSVSPPVLVYVFPRESVTVSRPDHNAINEVAAHLVVHTVKAGFRGEYVYFYTAASKQVRQRLIGRVRLRRTSAGSYGVSAIGADLRFVDSKTFYVSACIRHAALPDMGTPFTDAACGRPTLPAAR